MSHPAPPRRRLNGWGLASVIVGTLGVASAVPLGIGLVMVGLILDGVAIEGDGQWDLLLILASWFVAVPAAGLFGLAGLATSVTGLFRRPRALAGVGLGLSLLTALLAAAAVAFLLAGGGSLWMWALLNAAT